MNAYFNSAPVGFKVSLLSILFLFMFATPVISQTWQTVNGANSEYMFSMPNTYTAHDTLNTFLYSARIGTSVLLESHYTSVAPIDYDAGDPYEMFAQALILQTGGTLESASWVLQSGLTGREVGVRFSNPADSSEPYFLFVRIFFHNDHMYSFSASSKESELSSLLTSKMSFFNSVNIF